MPVPEAVNQIARRSLRDDVYFLLRDAIVSGRYRPGRLLREPEIETLTGASRTPIREALGRLVQDGFVLVLPQRETRVAPLRFRVIADAFVVFQHILTASLPNAVNALDETDQHALRDYLRIAADGRVAEAAAMTRGELFDNVMTLFVEAAGNSTMVRASQAIALHIQWLATVYPATAERMAIGYDRMRTLVDACAQGDVDRARVVLEDWGRDVLCALVDPSELPVISPSRRAAPRVLLRDQVYTAVLDAITTGTLTPGERLREDQLMEWLGVSRTPLREGLSRLETIGLIEVLPRRLTRVTPITRQRAVEVASALSVLAQLAIRLGTPKLCVQDFAALRSARMNMRDACGGSDLPAAIAACISVLDVVAEASENEALITIIRSLNPWLYRCSELRPDPDFAFLQLVFDEFTAALLNSAAAIAATHLVVLFARATESAPNGGAFVWPGGSLRGDH